MPQGIAINADSSQAIHATRIRSQGILLALIVMGAGLRLLSISHQSFWYDEAVAANLAKHSATELLTGAVRDNGNPPLYWILLHFWSQCVGSSDGALRMLSALFGVLCIPLIYATGREVATGRIAVVATLLCAVSPYQVYLSQEARTYTLFMFLGMLSALSLLRGLDRPDLARYWVLHACATCAMLYAHYYGFFMVAAELAFVFAHPNCSRRVLFRALGSFSAAAIGFLPWLPSFLVQLHTPGNLSRSTETWWMHAAASPFIFGLGRTLIWKRHISPFRIAVAAVGGAGIITAMAAGIWSARRAPRSVFLYLWFGFNLGIPWLVSATVSPLYAERYGALASVPFYIFVAYGLCELPAQLKLPCRVAIGTAMLISIAFYFTSVMKADWRDAVRYVEERSKEGDLLLFDADFNETSYARYATLPEQRLRLTSASLPHRLFGTDRAGGSVLDFTDRVLKHPRVWLVLSDAESGALARYEAIFTSWTWSKETQFWGIRIWVLERSGDVDSR